MNRAAASLYAAIGLDMAGFGMVLPDIQTRMEAEGANGLLIGSVLAAYFLVQMLLSPRWGRWSDRVGRKPILVWCGALSALSLLVYGFATNVWIVLASRILAGIAAANIVAAQAYLIDSVSAPDDAAASARRTTLLGRMGAAMLVGEVFGPALGGILSAIGGNLLLGIVAAALSGLSALTIALFVPSVPPKHGQQDDEGSRKAPKTGLLRDIPRLRFLVLLASAALLALACLEGTFGRLIRHRFGYGPFEFGLIFGWESLIGALSQTFLLPVLGKCVPTAALLVASYFLQAVGLLFTPFAPNLAFLFFFSTLYALGNSVAGVTVNSLASETTPPERQGEMFGIMQSARSAGFLFGPLLGGVLFDWRIESPYVLAGVVLLACAVAVGIRFRGAREQNGNGLVQ